MVLLRFGDDDFHFPVTVCTKAKDKAVSFPAVVPDWHDVVAFKEPSLSTLRASLSVSHLTPPVVSFCSNGITLPLTTGAGVL